MPPERCASPPSPPFHAIDVPQRTSPAPHHRSPAPSAPPAVSSSAPPVGTHDTKVFACTIGRKPSKAKYYLDDPADIVRLIQASSSMESPTMTASSAFEPSPEMERFLCERLLDAAQPIAERFRALFSLRNLRGDAPRCALLQAARDSSNLLAHEAAFALGQMQDAEAIPALEAVLKDLSLHPIVRHEAAEALGAIGLAKSIPLLEESLAADPAVEVRETCELALKRIEEQKNVTGAESTTISPFLSVDPALPAKQGVSVEQLRELLLNEQESMYERYAALFALRNDGGDAAVSAIVAALGVKSALLRHEVAYVLGQLQNKAASDALSAVLKNVDEHPMVRHEAAEALGSIADQESIALLEEFAKDAEPIVSQSCEVALSMLEYERSGKSFEFLFLQTPQVQQES